MFGKWLLVVKYELDMFLLSVNAWSIFFKVLSANIIFYLFLFFFHVQINLSLQFRMVQQFLIRSHFTCYLLMISSLRNRRVQLGHVSSRDLLVEPLINKVLRDSLKSPRKSQCARCLITHVRRPNTPNMLFFAR